MDGWMDGFLIFLGHGFSPKKSSQQFGFFNAEIMACGITQVLSKLETNTLIDVDRSSGKQGFFRQPSRDSWFHCPDLYPFRFYSYLSLLSRSGFFNSTLKRNGKTSEPTRSCKCCNYSWTWVSIFWSNKLAISSFRRLDLDILRLNTWPDSVAWQNDANGDSKEQTP